MKKKAVFLLVITSALLAIFIFTMRETYPPKRPTSIDSQADWAGGPDGGAWVTCERVTSIKNTFLCSVYGEDGSLLKRETYELMRSAFNNSDSANNSSVRFDLVKEAYTIDELKQTGFSAYDGTKIYLSGDLVLIPEKHPNK